MTPEFLFSCFYVLVLEGLSLLILSLVLLNIREVGMIPPCCEGAGLAITWGRLPEFCWSDLWHKGWNPTPYVRIFLPQKSSWFYFFVLFCFVLFCSVFCFCFFVFVLLQIDIHIWGFCNLKMTDIWCIEMCGMYSENAACDSFVYDWKHARGRLLGI